MNLYKKSKVLFFQVIIGISLTCFIKKIIEALCTGYFICPFRFSSKNAHFLNYFIFWKIQADVINSIISKKKFVNKTGLMFKQRCSGKNKHSLKKQFWKMLAFTLLLLYGFSKMYHSKVIHFRTYFMSQQHII